MTGTSAACLHTNQSRSYLNHLVYMVGDWQDMWRVWVEDRGVHRVLVGKPEGKEAIGETKT